MSVRIHGEGGERLVAASDCYREHDLVTVSMISVHAGGLRLGLGSGSRLPIYCTSLEKRLLPDLPTDGLATTSLSILQTRRYGALVI